MKLLLKSVLVLSMAIIVLLAVVGFWLRTDVGIKVATDFVAGYIEKQIDHDYKIKIANPKFSFPFVVEVQELSLSENDSEIISVQNLCINIFPSLLWRKNITIWDLSAGQIIVSKIPDAVGHPEEPGEILASSRGSFAPVGIPGDKRLPRSLAAPRNDATSPNTPRNDVASPSVPGNDVASLVDDKISFIPKIDVQNIVVNKIILSSLVTGLEGDISFNIEGNLSFDSNDKVVSFQGKVREGGGRVLSVSEGFGRHPEGGREADRKEPETINSTGSLRFASLAQDDVTAAKAPHINHASSSLLRNSYLDIKGKYNLDNSNMNISEFKLSAANSDVEGALEINATDLSLKGHARYKSSLLELYLPGQKNLFEGIVDVAGPLSNLQVKTEGSGYLRPNEQSYFALPQATWKSDFIIDKNDLKGKISFTSGAIRANGEIGKNGQKFYLKNFSTKGNSLISGANLVFDNQTKTVTGELNANSKNLNELKEFFPFLKKGTVDLRANFTKNMSGAQQSTVMLKVKHLATDFGNCDLANIDLAIKNLWEMKLSHANIKFRSISTALGSVRDFTLTAKDNGDSVGFESEIKSLDPYPVQLKVDGSIRHPEGGIRHPELTERHPELVSGSHKALLQSPEIPKQVRDDVHGVRNDAYQIASNIKGSIGRLMIATPEAIKFAITKGNAGISVLAPNIQVNGGKLNINATVVGDNVKGKLFATKFPAMIVPDFLPEIFKDSLISGEISLNGPVIAPVFDSELEFSNIELIKKDPEYATLKLSMKLHSGILSIDSDIFQAKQVLGSFKAQVPYKLSLSPFLATISRLDPISASLKLNKETNILALIPTPPGHKLLGYANGQMQLSGSFASPIINGSIVFNKTEYKHKAYGINLKDISVKVTAQNNNILITNFIAKDVYSNAVYGDGKLFILNDMPFTFNLKTDKFNFLSTPYVQGEMGGHLSISGNSTKALAKGSFVLGPLEIKIPEHFSDDIPTLNITETLNQKKIIYEMPNKPYDLRLDIDLIAKQQVFVRGRGVNTLLSGSLKINNNVRDPYIFGKLYSVRGSYQEFGKILAVKEGVITFDGPISPSPYLNIVGVTSVNGEEIRLILAGSIFNPDIKIESSGASSSEGALSKLLFGKNPESISTMQALALADGMRRISGHGGGLDPMALGRKILGVDEISIKNNEDTETTSVGVGKYLTDKVYLEIEQGDEVSGAKTRIEVEITPKISIEGLTSEKGGSSVGVNWRFDY